VKRWLALAAVCLVTGVAVLLVVLAIDVRREGNRLGRDDTAFRLDPTRGDLWRPPQVAPFDAARRLLGITDQVAYRHVVQLFALSRPKIDVLRATASMQTYRSIAAVQLWSRAQHDPDTARRSRELNMLGILDLVSAGPADRIRRLAALVRASGSFRNAIIADERNADAKFNLELTLRLIRTATQTTASLKGLGGAATQSRDFGAGY
jgi:hypothetical protein